MYPIKYIKKKGMKHSMSYDRQFVSQQLILQSDKIPPSVCFGRKGTEDAEKNFVLAFFVTRTPEELSEISEFVSANYLGKSEVLLCFFMKRDDGTASTLTSEEMKTFDFRKYPIKLSVLPPTWDNLRNIVQPLVGITFG